MKGEEKKKNLTGRATRLPTALRVYHRGMIFRFGKGWADGTETSLVIDIYGLGGFVQLLFFCLASSVPVRRGHTDISTFDTIIHG